MCNEKITKLKEKPYEPIWINCGWVCGAVTHYGVSYDEEEKEDYDSSYWDFWQKHDDSVLTLDEDDSAILVEEFFDAFYDEAINRACGFEHWGNNFYTPEAIAEILDEMKEFVEILKKNTFDERISTRILIDHVGYIFRDNEGFDVFPYGKNQVEKLKYLDKYKAVVIDFYERFISCMESIIRKNPDYKYFVVSGP